MMFKYAEYIRSDVLQDKEPRYQVIPAGMSFVGVYGILVNYI